MKPWEMSREQLSAEVSRLEALVSSGDATTGDKSRLNDCKLRVLDLHCPVCGKAMPSGYCLNMECPEFSVFMANGTMRCPLCGKPSGYATLARVRLPSGAIAMVNVSGLFSLVGTPVRYLCCKCAAERLVPLVADTMIQDRGNYLVGSEGYPENRSEEARLRARRVFGVACGREKHDMTDDVETWLSPGAVRFTSVECSQPA